MYSYKRIYFAIGEWTSFSVILSTEYINGLDLFFGYVIS